MNEKELTSNAIETVEGEVIEAPETELQVTPTAVSAGVVTWNYDELKTQATEVATRFSSVAITDENYKEIKATDKKLGGYVSKLREAKKRVDDKLSAPKKLFDSQVNDVIKILQDGQDEIKAKYGPYDEARLKAKTDKIVAYKDKQLGTSGLRPEYASRVIVTGVTLSSKVGDDKTAVDKQIQNLINEQTTFDQVTAAVNSAVTAGNGTVSQKMGEREVNSYVARAMENCGHQSAEDIVTFISSQINSDFTSLREREEKIREEALRKERERVAKEEKEKAEALAAQAQKAAEQAAAAPVTQDPQNADDTAQTPEGQGYVYHFAIALEGNFNDIAACGNEIKAVCEKHGVTFIPYANQSGYYIPQKRA